jgi:acid phosphatase
MTTLQPRKPYTDGELQKLYPPGLKLHLVQILLRHGERTPVSARFRNAGLTPFWPYCGAVAHLRSAVLGEPGKGGRAAFGTFEWKRRLETFGEQDEPVLAVGAKGELDAICDFGSLTDTGRLTTLELGTRLRRLYVDRLGFLPPSISNTDFLYLRSTPVPRALESLQQTFSGLYPPSTRDSGLPPPTILTRAHADETLFPNDGNCRRFAALSRAFAQRTADRWNATEEMEYLNQLYGKWMPSNFPRVAVDGHPRLSGIQDTVNATLAHGPETRLPKEFYDLKGRKIMEKISVEEWYAGYRESREYRTLGIGGLLGDIVARMVGSAERTSADGRYELLQNQDRNATRIRFGLSGCHDTTLAAILASLGALGEQWPPFTSHIAIELFNKSSAANEEDGLMVSQERERAPVGTWTSIRNYFGGLPEGKPPPGIGRKKGEDLTASERGKLQGYYVRLRYNDETVIVPGCRKAGNHLEGDESFCTLVSLQLL